jgi:5-formyltetrahydrofolate cyclo-ligase
MLMLTVADMRYNIDSRLAQQERITMAEKITSASVNTGDAPERPEAQRQSLRMRLLSARENIPDRAPRESALVNRVARWLNTMPLARLAFYWPIKGEADLTGMIARWLAADTSRRAALPVVMGDVLQFAPWTPGTPMQTGRYGIPVPPGDDRLTPQLLLIPCLGFDAARFRLGYGGGFYDRTLAQLKVKPVTVGVAFDCGRLPSIGPQEHDIKLDLVISETGVL